jgi:hypothetical protein
MAPEQGLRKRVDEHRLEEAWGVSRWVVSDLEDTTPRVGVANAGAGGLSAPHDVGKAA